MRVADGLPAYKCMKIFEKWAGWRPHAVKLRCAFGSARCDTGKTLFPHGWWLGVPTQIKKIIVSEYVWQGVVRILILKATDTEEKPLRVL